MGLNFLDIDPALAKQQLTDDRKGHWFKSTLIGHQGMVTWRFINLDNAANTVTIEIDGDPQWTFANLKDMGNLQYWGPVKPASGPTGGGLPAYCWIYPFAPGCRLQMDFTPQSGQRYTQYWTTITVPVYIPY